MRWASLRACLFVWSRPLMVNTWRITARHAATTRRCYSTARRPFKFHVGVSFLGKPQQRNDKYTQGQIFPDGPLKEWRDHGLEWSKGLLSTSAGHDFYFVQEVCTPWITQRLHADFLVVSDAEAVGRYASVTLKRSCAVLIVSRLRRDWLLESRMVSVAGARMALILQCSLKL